MAKKVGVVMSMWDFCSRTRAEELLVAREKKRLAAEERAKLRNRANMLSRAGDYSALDCCLAECPDVFSPIVELDLRIICLLVIAYRQAAGAHTDDKDVFPKEISSSVVETIGDSKDEQEAFFDVCSIFARVIVQARNIITECAFYEEDAVKAKPFEVAPETRPKAVLYKRLMAVASCSSFLNCNGFLSDGPTLADLALANYSWEEKVARVGKEQYNRALANVVLRLCSPERHRQIDSYLCVERAITIIDHISWIPVIELVERYYDDIAAAAISGKPVASDYLTFAFDCCRTGVAGSDELRGRLERFFSQHEDLRREAFSAERRLAIAMSRRGHAQLCYAEELYYQASCTPYGGRDASNLAHEYFRVLEYEYNSKLIIPFINMLDFEEVKRETGYRWVRKHARIIMPEFDEWWGDLKEIGYIKDGPGTSMMLGTMRKLLEDIVESQRCLDKCSELLIRGLEPYLSEAGLRALHNGDIVKPIEKDKVDHFRNPGGHVGFLTFSQAIEARRHVLYWLPRFYSWVRP